MTHYTCDACKRPLDQENDLRYVVRIEVYAAYDPVDTGEVDSDRDHLLELQDILQCMEDSENERIGEDVYEHRRLDLCAECQRKFIKNPLGLVERGKHFDFSQN